MSEPHSVWELGAELGEGPVWVERDQALWFVDIKKKHIHCFDPASGDKQSWDAPEFVGFALPARSGGFIAGLQSGLARFDPADGSFSRIAAVEPNLPDNRLNDAVTDPTGTMWFGSMDNREVAKSGAFYRFSIGKVHAAGVADIEITNGPAVSPDGRTIYLVDTLGRSLTAADLGPDGRIGPRRPFLQLTEADGYPDGPTIDSEGCVWVSIYAGWETRRYSPAGELLQRVRFPVPNVTKIAFGGPDLTTAYATTARQGMSAEELDRAPQSGDLFSFQVDVPGVSCAYVAD
ncbi:SMP-30/gluconolactonase/LRE family protein [Sphingomonas piscis]|uniref:SMP-30/gluconolactonase/LRE family protein n=1 Tax=Sphingomonas piscis TaxID=2714943 RepID=A0A6G7YN77_9SPHN|nr:SMP-30/gluconolactonase/LRE family protein [Sphingomonas piscis]QIK78191.1 SMP-30/gluconolactonase/LRE family protein [Sphingomonas piscis]